MLRRRLFALLGLPGLLEGQAHHAPQMSMNDNLEHKPVNNECPVCGTMADPFVSEGLTATAFNITRCRFCNNAFFQLIESRH